MALTTNNGHYLSLDIGQKRIGVALASFSARLSEPLMTLLNNDQTIPRLKGLISEYDVQRVVVGLPTTLTGHDSAQTVFTKEYIKGLKKELKIKIVTQDEALSSLRAEAELKSHGKMFNKADIDKLAACLILEDYLSNERL